MVAQVCDLLDAAAALGGVPLLALVTVRELSGDINRKAWTGDQWSASHRAAIINKSLHHQFSAADFQAISEALIKLDGKSNRAAWRFVRQLIPDDVLYRRLAEPTSAEYLDAIDDIGTDKPSRVNTSGVTYARDPQIREAVKRRAGGKCEFCGELGFQCSNCERYVECHHIIALADQGADRMTNVIALCPNHHREAHFGERRAALEREMIQKVMILEGKGTATV
jgi:predicted HNH restriction endonuclease